jgi:thiamine biosynthesis lipoprotein ApbE
MNAVDSAHPAWTHAAMSTRFRVVLLHSDRRYAGQAAEAAFAELERLERRLSRFVEESDVSRINRLAVGQSTTVDPDTFDCLRIAERIRCETGGIFDVAYRSAGRGCENGTGSGSRMSGACPIFEAGNGTGSGSRTSGACPISRDEGENGTGSGSRMSGACPIFEAGNGTGSGSRMSGACPISRGSPRFLLHAEKLQVRALVSGLCVDLGGIGKGYALDRLSALLKDWELDAAFLAADTSTLLAQGVPPGRSGWALTIGSDRRPVPWTLARGAISASGTAARGNHLVDPRTGRAESQHHRVWAAAPSAAVADALSTAFSLMTAAEIQAYCQPRPRISAWLLDHPDGELRALRT